MIQLLPIILFFVILIVIALGIFYVSAKIRINRFGYWLLAGYTFVILCSVVIYTLLPAENLPTEIELTGDEARADIMHHVAYRGLPIEDFEKYKTDKWEFEVPADESISLYVNASDYYFPVIIEKVNDKTNISAALYYAEPRVNLEPLYGGNRSVQVRLENNELIITPQEQGSYQYAQLSKEFPFTQFSGKEEQLDYIGLSIYTGEYVLYLQVPENQELLIIDESINYEYIN